MLPPRLFTIRGGQTYDLPSFSSYCSQESRCCQDSRCSETTRASEFPFSRQRRVALQIVGSSPDNILINIKVAYNFNTYNNDFTIFYNRNISICSQCLEHSDFDCTIQNRDWEFLKSCYFKIINMEWAPLSILMKGNWKFFVFPFTFAHIYPPR